VSSRPPAGRNRAYQDRRVCAGNTSCIPICPIQAKWDPTVTLGSALDTGNVTVQYQSVATNVKVDGQKNVVGIDYLRWTTDANGRISSTPGTAIGAKYVLAAHAIENAKLLLMSNNRQGVANRSDQVGRNLMDHVLYLSWALSAQPVFGYRGPLATAGIESLRDAFARSAPRSAWGSAAGLELRGRRSYTTAADFVNGLNFSGRALATPASAAWRSSRARFDLHAPVPHRLSDQAPQQENGSRWTRRSNGLRLPRPALPTGSTDATRGFKAARSVCGTIYKQMGATEFTANYAAQVKAKLPATSTTTSTAGCSEPARDGHAPDGPRSGHVGRRRESASRTARICGSSAAEAFHDWDGQPHAHDRGHGTQDRQEPPQHARLTS
jgi:hypothetical protein